MCYTTRKWILEENLENNMLDAVNEHHNAKKKSYINRLSIRKIGYDASAAYAAYAASAAYAS